MITLIFLNTLYGLTASLLIGGIFVGRDLWKDYIDTKAIWSAIDKMSEKKAT